MRQVTVFKNPVDRPPLTIQQQRAYALLLEGYSLSEIKKLLGLQSPAPVLSILEHLEEKGYLKIKSL